MNKLIEFLTQQMELNKLSYRKLSKKMGMSATHVSQVMQGRHPVTVNFCFGVSQSDLWSGGDVNEVLQLAGLLPVSEGGEEKC